MAITWPVHISMQFQINVKINSENMQGDILLTLTRLTANWRGCEGAYIFIYENKLIHFEYSYRITNILNSVDRNAIRFTKLPN